jgi:hypothetical protein
LLGTKGYIVVVVVVGGVGAGVIGGAMVVAGEGDATAVRMCSTKAANTDAAG